jgi:hypothetical protein
MGQSIVEPTVCTEWRNPGARARLRGLPRRTVDPREAGLGRETIRFFEPGRGRSNRRCIAGDIAEPTLRAVGRRGRSGRNGKRRSSLAARPVAGSRHRRFAATGRMGQRPLPRIRGCAVHGKSRITDDHIVAATRLGRRAAKAHRPHREARAQHCWVEDCRVPDYRAEHRPVQPPRRGAARGTAACLVRREHELVLKGRDERRR